MSNGITAWSYSRWSDYETCPLMFKLKHIDRIKPPSSPQMQRGTDIHKEGEEFLKSKRKRKVPESYKHFADRMQELRELDPVVELQEGFTQDWKPTDWFAKNTWLRIVCDVRVAYDDNTADIIDFKTGKKYDTNEHQMELFSTAPFMTMPDLEKVTTRLWYLDVPKDNEVIREYTRRDYEAIKRDWTKRVRPMFNDKRFAPKQNPKCRWCHFRKENGGPCKY
jgi:CRISPR/Cas system-associated exonuclease Cas4 (RecB family)